VAAAVLALTLHLGAPAAHAGTATLSWTAPTTNSDGSSLTDLAGYKVYVGTASGNYQAPVTVGKVTSYTLSNLTDGGTYYFAVSAYNTSGEESAKSNEASKTVPVSSYTITASAGSGGSVTAVGNSSVSSATNGSSTITSVSVAAGASQSFGITPASGYAIAGVTVDGASVGAVTSYTFTSVKANHTIAATFSATGSGTGTTTTPVFAVNSAGAQYTGSNGTVYSADTKYSGGSAASVTSTITGTADQKIYQSERFGNFSYAIPAANGNYLLTLKFAETYWGAAGKRVFNVAVNGSTVISNLDIYAKVGKNAAYDVTVPVSVTNGTLSVSFATVTDNAKVCGIVLQPSGTTTGSTTPLFAVNSAGAQYTGSNGIVYSADTKYSGGSVASVTSTITGTTDQTIYRSERFGNFSYNVPVANGNYTVRLKFAETYWGASGKRVFNVAINGATVISNLDIYAKVGKNAAYDVDIPVSVTNGALNIQFVTKVDNAKVSAIVVQGS